MHSIHYSPIQELQGKLPYITQTISIVESDSHILNAQIIKQVIENSKKNSKVTFIDGYDAIDIMREYIKNNIAETIDITSLQ